ncbi:MAG: DUF2341 domain-containing protein [Candidatus Hodarchaeales archaeon]
MPQLKADAFNKSLFNNFNEDLGHTNPELSSGSNHLKEETSYVSFPVKADIQSGDWGDSSFQYRKDIIIDCSKVPADLTDFPVLVVLFDDSLRFHAQVDGDDILFRDSSNNTLDHEIEHFDVTYNGSHAFLVAWIRIPVLSSDVNTTISMYYGNSTIGSQENATGVWGDDYVGVWHLDTDLTGSSSNSIDGTNQGSLDEIGKIGRARRFDGIDDYVSLGVWDPGIGSGDYSISAWVLLDTPFNSSSSESMPIFGHYEYESYDMAFTFAGQDNSHGSDGSLYTKVEGIGGSNFDYIDSSTTSWPGQSWIYIVATANQSISEGKIYVDGFGEGSMSNLGYPTFGTYGDYQIGRIDLDQTSDDVYETFTGVIDELRLYKGVVSADWITTEYNNQHDPTSFYTVSIEEQRDSNVTSEGLDVIIDTSVYDATDEYNPGPNIVFINDSHGYIFFQKTNGGRAEIVYYKTIDNGTTWNGPINIDCGPPEYRFRSFSCWFDQWTPNNTDTKIHFIANSIINDEMVYNFLDTKDDTSSGEWTVIMASTGSHNAPDGGGTVTVSTDGVVFGASWMYNGPQFAKYNSSWYDITPEYSFLDDDDDHGQLLPLSGGDILCVYEDTSSNSLYHFIYDEDLDLWDNSPTFITTITSEIIEDLEDNYNNNANWGAVINPNTHDIYLVLNNDIFNATGDLETWVFFNNNLSWIQKTDVFTNCGINGDEAKPVYDISGNTLFAVYINNRTVFTKNSTDGGETWGSERKVSKAQAEWIVIRTNFISSERIYTIYFDNENNDVYGITIADLERGPENATVRVNVLDLDNKRVPNARVYVTYANNASIIWTQNTTSLGYTIFANLPYDYYNITVEFENSINNTLTLLYFSTNSTYQLNPKYEFTVRISEFVDNDPPTVQNIRFINESILFDNSSTFFADVWDESNLIVVNLNLTVINITNEVILINKNFTMEEFTSDQFYNASALESLTHRNVQIFYNIIAIDIANNTMVTQINSFYLGDAFPPIIVEYDVSDYRNGTLQFYANITDNMSLVIDPVVLQINDSFVEMHQNASGFWVCYIEAYYGELLNYTIYSAVDSLGNENGSKVYLLSPSFRTIIPEDDEPPPIIEGDIIDNFDTHYHGQVEIYVSLEDQNDYQSGINESDVQLHVNINGDTFTFFMIESEEQFYYNLEFEFNDTVYYWINASDYANNPNSSLTRGPFIIDDNSMPTASYWKIDWGNGTVDFYAEIVDWPSNDTSAYLLYTQNYFGTWTNLSMDQVSDVTFFARIKSLEYNLQSLWYYVASVDTTNNWNNPGIAQATDFTLSDTVSPIITFTIENSTENDGEITISAYAIDPYGDTYFINNTFYINFTHSENHIIMEMDYEAFYIYKKSYSFPFGDQVVIKVWLEDNAGNFGEISKIITISDHAPPHIKRTGSIVFQNGTVVIWAEVEESLFGSGLLNDNSSVLLNYTYVSDHSGLVMYWNGTGNFYIYLIPGFVPERAFWYLITVFDNSGNLVSTSPQKVSIFDETDPICTDYGYKNTTLNQYSCLLIFWAEANDPFGSINEVNLTINNLNGFGSWIETTEMLNNGSHYIHSIIMVCNQSFNYSIMIYDTALNNISIREINQKTSNFQPAEIVDYGINTSTTHIGEILFWCELHDLFNSHNVTLSVKDDTIGKWILNETKMISNKTHSTYMLPIDYLHNFSYIMRVIDDGVLKDYYEANQYLDSSQVFDWWEPIIHSAGIVEVNKTTILIWTNVSDWGSGVSEVFLNYGFTSPGVTGGYGSDIQMTRVPMTFNQTYYIIELSFSKSVTFEWFIEANDSANRSNGSNRSNYTFLYPSSSIVEYIPAFIMVIVGTVLVVIMFYGISTTYQKRKKKQLSEISESHAKLDSLLNTYMILVTTAVGLPVYNVSNIKYQSSSGIQDVLSGLSVGIDSFLESFQSDILNIFVETDSELSESQTKDNIRTSIIEKNKVQIQIVSSPSFKIFLFLKEKPLEYVKSTFITIARGFEEKITLHELGIVDETLVEPIAEKLIKQHFPITLLSSFHIDCQRLKIIEEGLKRGDSTINSISRSSLNALKRLVIVKSNLDVRTNNDPQAQINLFDKSLASNKLRDVPSIILSEALEIYKKILKVDTKVVYKALWIGSSPEVNVVVPTKTNPQ